MKSVTGLLYEIVQLTLYGKGSAAISSSQHALRYLSWLNPEAIFPSLIVSLYPSLEGLESHRTMSALGVVCNISVPLLRRTHYPEGGRNLVSLLFLTIPGIDLNDVPKSILSLLSVLSLVANVPIIDSSPFAPAHDESPDEEACRVSTAEFEAVLALFLEKIFQVLENLPQNFGVGHYRMNVEENLLHSIYVVCDVVFNQLSDNLETVVLNILFKKVQSTLTPAATEAIGVLCGLIAKSNPGKRISKFLPLCCEMIKEEIRCGASSVPSGNRYVANPNPFEFAKMSDAQCENSVD